ncbi:MAG: disulfide bond formation protein DsbA [Mesorhizobium amorphae]|nr:MAG: disulfide bond formation protein DsbA [Mesorhizobium amorphae]
MTRKWFVGAALASLAIAGVVSGIRTEPAAAQEALDRAQVETIIREYLLANPEIMIEVQAELEKKQEAAQRLASVDAIRASKAEIFDSALDGVIGNPNGKTTVVEFYDYNCGFCRQALPDMQALAASDPDLRVVLKEFPILGPDSQKAHLVSMAFRSLMPEKYGEFHKRLLGSEGRAGEASAIELAVSLGADEAKLREAMEDPAIMAAFQQTYELANRLGINGTPAYVMGDQVVSGALGLDVMREKVAEVRACTDAGTC